MDKLQSNIIQHIYEYDNTYKIKFGKVLKQLIAHCLSIIAKFVSSLGIIVVATVKFVELILKFAINYIMTVGVLMLMFLHDIVQLGFSSM